MEASKCTVMGATHQPALIWPHGWTGHGVRTETTCPATSSMYFKGDPESRQIFAPELCKAGTGSLSSTRQAAFLILPILSVASFFNSSFEDKLPIQEGMNQRCIIGDLLAELGTQSTCLDPTELKGKPEVP